MVKKSVARPYSRSNVPRQRWTSDLHHYFVQVVKQLGGEIKATPKKIFRLMSGIVRILTISQVKSHLQMYRNKKRARAIQAERMVQQMKWRQSQQYLRIYERIRNNTNFIQNHNQQRLYMNIDKKITAFIKSNKGVSCKSLFQSSRIGQNETGVDDGAPKEEVSKNEEELSLELNLGLKL